MGNTLPPQGFHKTSTSDLEAPISDGAYRFLQWIKEYCWDGTPYFGPTAADVQRHFMKLLRLKADKTIRNYTSELETAGLIETRLSSRGYEIAPAGMIAANSFQPPLVTDSDGKNFPNSRKKNSGKNFPSKGKVGGSSLNTSLPPAVSTASKVAQNSTPDDGKNFPNSRKKSSKNPAAPEFGKKLPKPERDYDDIKPNPADAVDKTGLTPQETEYLARLEDINLYGKWVLRAVRKAIAHDEPIEALLARAQRHLAECKADGDVKDAYRAAGYRLAQNRERRADTPSQKAEKGSRATRETESHQRARAVLEAENAAWDARRAAMTPAERAAEDEEFNRLMGTG